MRLPAPVKLALSPPAELSELDTGLRFTDILFGFVISQIFLRLQHFGELPVYVRWQLIASTALVLGSWIGFRRSLNRSSYELKFFNLPLARFIVDQVMILLYFRVAVLTSSDPSASVDPSSLTRHTLVALVFIFGLYALWDFGGLLMSIGPATRKYPESEPDLPGFAITLGFWLVFGLLYYVADTGNVDTSRAGVLLAVATGLLLVYRWAKEIRSTSKYPQGRPRRARC